jgi:hypothetical protein
MRICVWTGREIAACPGYPGHIYHPDTQDVRIFYANTLHFMHNHYATQNRLQ